MTNVAIKNSEGTTIYVKSSGAGTNDDPQVNYVNVNNAVADGGPSQTIVRTYTASADMTTAAAITVAPTSGQKVVLMDLLVSTDTEMSFAIQMETSNNVLAKFYMPAKSTMQVTLRGFIKGDAVDKRIFGKASVAGNVSVTAVQFSEA